MTSQPAALDILHLPDVIGGHPTALAHGEQKCGARSQTLCYEPSPYHYRADRTLIHHGAGVMRKWSERISVFLQVRKSHDIYHFNFGSSLLQAPRAGMILPEIAFYQGMKFMTFQGDDARITYPDILQRSIEMETRLGRYSAKRARRAYVDGLRLKKRKIVIARAAKHCHHIFALNPDLLSGLPADKSSFLPYAVELPELHDMEKNNRPAGGPLKLVHLSTAPAIKGTGLIEQAVAKAAEFCDVTIDVVVQRPRREALKRLAAADYLIDQMVLGWFGATAVEAMYLGVPVICHLDEQALERVPEIAHELPIVQTNIENLANRIVELARQREQRTELVSRSIAYANKWHRPQEVAKLTLKAYFSAINS